MKAIAAMSRNRVIGAGGKIPWHLSEDLKFFKRTTLGHVILMGRKTYDSIGRPLPGRENWVLTRQKLVLPGVRVFQDPRDLPVPDGEREIFLIGGAQLYAAMLPQCSEILLTRVQREVEGDTFFPPFEEEFECVETLFEAPGMEGVRYVRRARCAASEEWRAAVPRSPN